MNTEHAAVRAQQRGIPPLIKDWLLQFGEEQFDGHGGIKRFFSHRSIREMERCFGRKPVSRMSEFLEAYLIESSHDGVIITIGHNYRRSQRRH
jgi:hypothetical protein